MQNLTAGDLRIEAVQPDPAAHIQVHWTGASNDRDPGKVLGPYFSTLIAAAIERRAALEMHFEKLSHFNSSTITAIIRLIQEARDKKVELIIVFAQNLKWQKLSFDALRVFTKGDDLFQMRPTST